MSLVTLVTTLTTLLWCYILVLTVVWFRAVGATDRRDHVGHFVTLMGVFVPGVALTVSTVLIGATLGVPQVVQVMVLLLPGGVAVGLQLEVMRLTGNDLVQDACRLAVAVCLSALYISLA